MKYILPLLFLGIVPSAFAQIQYPAINIPPHLLKNAEAVIRTEELVFEGISASKAEESYKLAVTILNKNGDHYAELGCYYDKSQSINSIKATVYNADGKKTKEYGKNQFADRNYISDFSVFEDNRLKALTVYETTYPYTVVFEYTKSYKGVLGYPGWAPLNRFNVSCEKSSYKIITPASFSVYYLESNGAAVKKSAAGNKKIFFWEAANLDAYVYEPLTAGIGNLVPNVNVAPEEFEYDGYKGKQKNWSELGKWYFTIANGRQALPQAIKNDVHEIIKKEKTDHQKIAVLYKYMQSKMRYVSIQLGIGGLQPMTAQAVATLNYGDCKALSNYMMAILAEAGIKSNPIIIYGSRLPKYFHPTYSSISQGNHVILSVPLQKDTVWLECTNQRMPYNYLGSFTGNRNGLFVGPDGGKIVKTPVYTAEDNRQSRMAKVKLDANGNASANIVTTYTNEQFEDVFYQQLKSKKDQKEYLLQSLTLPTPSITSFAYVLENDKPSIKELITLEADKLLTPAGDKYFLSPNLLNKWTGIPQVVENRKTDFRNTMSHLDQDTLEYELPEGMEVEYKPEDVILKSEFGEYQAKYSIQGNKLMYIRQQKMNSKRYPASKYADYITFYKAIVKADRAKLLLKKT